MVRRGGRELARGRFDAVPSDLHGPITRDPAEPHRLVRDDGSTFTILGENRINIYDPAWNIDNLSIADYVARMENMLSFSSETDRSSPQRARQALRP